MINLCLIDHTEVYCKIREFFKKAAIDVDDEVFVSWKFNSSWLHYWRKQFSNFLSRISSSWVFAFSIFVVNALKHQVEKSFNSISNTLRHQVDRLWIDEKWFYLQSLLRNKWICRFRDLKASSLHYNNKHMITESNRIIIWISFVEIKSKTKEQIVMSKYSQSRRKHEKKRRRVDKLHLDQDVKNKLSK